MEHDLDYVEYKEQTAFQMSLYKKFRNKKDMKAIGDLNEKMIKSTKSKDNPGSSCIVRLDKCWEKYNRLHKILRGCVQDMNDKDIPAFKTELMQAEQ